MRIVHRAVLWLSVVLVAGVLSALVVLRQAAAGSVAQVGEPVIPTDLLSLLMWLTTAGGASAVVSFIAEKLPVWQLPPESGGLSSQAKWWIMLVASAVLSILAKLLIDFLPASVITALSPYVALVIGVFVTFLANQAAHGIQRARWKDQTRG